MTRQSLALVALVALTASARAQYPVPQPPPLLYAKLLGPAGMRATFYQGEVGGKAIGTPAVVGVRAGYIQRFKIDSMSRYPGVTLYPSFEVRGTLRSPGLNHAHHPAPVVFSEQDVEQALRGALITKVVYLEDPERAVPTATNPDQPMESERPANRDLLAEAKEMGRPVLVVRLGDHQWSEADLSRLATPGTVLFPGQRALMPPPCPPQLPWMNFPWYDPILGPKPPEDECLRDGGDRGPRAGFDQNGKLQGVEPEDTVASFTDAAGRRRVAKSNRICVCVPRYAVLRNEVLMGQLNNAVGPLDARGLKGYVGLENRVPAVVARQTDHIFGAEGRVRPSQAQNNVGLIRLNDVQLLQAHQLDIGPGALIGSKQVFTLTEIERTKLLRQIEVARMVGQHVGPSEAVGRVGTAVVARVQNKPEIVTATVQTRDISCCCDKQPVMAPDRPLVLCKWADKTSAQIGDELTLTIKYTNAGPRPLTDIAVTDSLTGRLEYVPGSSESDRDAVFTTQANEAGSLTLRWEVTGTLQPGQHGVVRFKVRVR